MTIHATMASVMPMAAMMAPMPMGCTLMPAPSYSPVIFVALTVKGAVCAVAVLP